MYFVGKCFRFVLYFYVVPLGQFFMNAKGPYMQFGPDASSQFVAPRFPIDQQGAAGPLRFPGTILSPLIKLLKLLYSLLI